MNSQIRHLALFWCCALPLVVAACGGESPTEGTEVEVEVIDGSLLRVTGDGQVGSLGRPLSDSLVVKVADASGAGLPGVTVRWSVTSIPLSQGGLEDHGTVSPTPTETDSEGLAKVQWTLGLKTGQQTATEQPAVASASVSGVRSLIFTATTPSLVPLTDMGASTYFGFPGGLYPGGNVMPQAHADAGQAAAAAIEPLGVNGDPSPSGKYVLLVNGHFNTMLISCDSNISGPCPPFTLVGQAAADPEVEKTNLAIVRGAPAEAEPWVDPNDSQYDLARERLTDLGLSEKQVQVVWAQWVLRGPRTPLPDAGAHALLLVNRMGNVMRAFKIRYPNLRLVFLTSSVYSGYSNAVDGQEAVGYETGFPVKWLVQAQIDQMAGGGAIVDVRAGDLDYNGPAPWIAWGPYLWADGVNPRADGLSWPISDFEFRRGLPVNGVQLSPEGREKAASLLLTFFKTSPQTRCWFVAEETC